MLAVITFMATTFLVLSRRERNSVNTNTDQTTARFTADTALERAKVQLLAGILASGNDQNFDLMVPTNFFNPFGFDPGAVDYRTNVNYNYDKNGNPLTAAQQQQNIANLLYDPRPPVYITSSNDFRYYLDLNRNGRYDTNGMLPEFSSDPAFPYIGTNGLNTASLASALFGNFTGDPEWIGVLRFPDRPHSADNPFVSRWTYIVLPAGKTLDVNYLHNQAFNPGKPVLDPFGADYQRNQGVGTWELNLAAFLYDLNTNTSPVGWGGLYTYDVLNPIRVVNGNAFADAEAIYRYRLNGTAGTAYNLNPANQMFQGAALPFLNDGIDQYADGDLMRGIKLDESLNPDPVNRPWPGADNPNHFFTSQDFFDPAKTSANFINRLIGAGTFNDSYNRYTFYRMLAQLGTDSSPPVEDKININYRNVTNGVVIAGMATNLYAWTPLEFFTNSAARLFEKLNLRDRNGNLVTVTNIPIWPTTNNNYYTPAVHRVLQLAANIFEATTNSLYPCIYRPLFSRDTAGTNIYISGYELVNGSDNLPTPPLFISQFPVDVNDPVVQAAIAVAPLQSQRNIYGAPWVIGAKKGFPNLNQIALQSVSQMTRKLLVSRPLIRNLVNGWTDYHAKQMFVIGVSNNLAVEVWNSYNTIYPRPLYIQADCKMTVELTNALDGVAYLPPPITFNLGGAGIGVGATNLPAGSLSNTRLQPPNTAASKQAYAQSFVVPLLANVIVLPDSIQIGGAMYAAGTNSTAQWNALPWDKLSDPRWGLNITNNLRCIVMDGGPNGRVVDYVQLSRLDTVRDLTAESLRYANGLDVWTPTTNTTTYWASAALPMSEGVIQQIQISQGSVPTSATEWSDNGLSAGTKTNAIANFFAFMTAATVVSGSNTMQAPFTPTAKMRQMTKWQANDPLVHYLAEDLTYLDGVTNDIVKPPNSVTLPKVTDGMYRLNDRYSPWGGNGPKSGWDPAYEGDHHIFDTALKDPFVMAPDNWNFPTNKFPSVGWLGRVHRGTPWQTAYMKSANILDTDPTAWQKWSGSGTLFLATNIAPIVDRQLFEVFTTALSDNATRGQLSINQTNLAAWSAVLSGVIVLTNDPVTAASTLSPAYGPGIISPAGVFNPAFPPLPPLAQIVQGINNTRANFASQTFTNLGDILATPELTDVSPYLITNNLQQQIDAGGITDEVLERIPQQVMSLLTISHSPRFVVYSYGQTLHPANNSVLTTGPFNGMSTNYQVTAETATRAVIRVEGAPKNPHVIVEQYNVLPPD